MVGGVRIIQYNKYILYYLQSTKHQSCDILIWSLFSSMSLLICALTCSRSDVGFTSIFPILMARKGDSKLLEIDNNNHKNYLVLYKM